MPTNEKPVVTVVNNEIFVDPEPLRFTREQRNVTIIWSSTARPQPPGSVSRDRDGVRIEGEVAADRPHVRENEIVERAAWWAIGHQFMCFNKNTQGTAQYKYTIVRVRPARPISTRTRRSSTTGERLGDAWPAKRDSPHLVERDFRGGAAHVSKPVPGALRVARPRQGARAYASSAGSRAARSASPPLRRRRSRRAARAPVAFRRGEPAATFDSRSGAQATEPVLIRRCRRLASISRAGMRIARSASS